MDLQFKKNLLSALALELPYPERTILTGGRAAAVLILFGRYQRDIAAEELSALITRRTDSVGSHKGQMAFPGGVSEADELGSPEGAIRTALRETEEEVGIPASAVEVIGTLPPLGTITGYQVTPVVGLLKPAIEEMALRLSDDEIAHALWVPMRTLMEPGVYRAESKRVGGVDYPIHVYQVQEHRVWGATGSMIKNLLDRLQSLG